MNTTQIRIFVFATTHVLSWGLQRSAANWSGLSVRSRRPLLGYSPDLNLPIWEGEFWKLCLSVFWTYVPVLRGSGPTSLLSYLRCKYSTKSWAVTWCKVTSALVSYYSCGCCCCCCCVFPSLLFSAHLINCVQLINPGGFGSLVKYPALVLHYSAPAAAAAFSPHYYFLRT